MSGRRAKAIRRRVNAVDVKDLPSGGWFGKTYVCGGYKTLYRRAKKEFR